MPTLHDVRTEYGLRGLSEADADPSAVTQFSRWLHDAVSSTQPEPTACTLATAAADGSPNARVVLLKEFDEHGFVFFTNYESAKGRELVANARASLVFFWPGLERQVRAAGAVARTSAAESEAYFRSRPRQAKIGAWASRQSRVLAGREELEREVARLEAQYADKDVPLPPFWGGFRLVPAWIEFWQGRPSRLHDRLRYTRVADESWKIERLSP
jgi:pyridoxamine 5'-phosphate oxidase